MFKKKTPLTRAEAVRLRKERKDHPRKWLQKDQPKFNQRQMPPVLVRGVNGSILINNQRKPRKRLDIPLNRSGVELRLPAIPMVKLGWRALSGVMTIGLLALLVFFFQSDLFRVHTIRLQGANRLTFENINAVIGVVNQSVFTLEPKALERELKENVRDLRDVSVRVGFPASVFVIVEERTPVLEWEQDGRVFWVDKEGVKYSPRGDVEALPRVIASGNPSITTNTTSEAFGQAQEQPFLTSAMIDAILEIREKLPEDRPIIYDPSYGIGWLEQDGWKVYLGLSVHDFDEKMSVYEAIVDYLRENGQTPYLIDVEYTYAPFVRLEP